jgi:DNA (cytosine-5)-methyltransferase 1
VNVLSLFSGIGGIDLGFERAGHTIVGQVEIDPFCRAVLEKHWPGLWRHDDVTTLEPADVPGCDVITGGFPCQDVSAAGKGAGIGGARSGLWFHMARLVAGVRPTWVLVENVPALRSRGADRVLADLEELGYSCWPLVVGAWAVGAPHRRDRVWIVAHATCRRDDEGRYLPVRPGEPLEAETDSSRAGPPMADSESTRLEGHGANAGQPEKPEPRDGGSLGDPPQRRQGAFPASDTSDANSESPSRSAIAWGERGWWATEPDVGRVAHGVPARMDRLRGLGNAVVPQVVEAVVRAMFA